MSLSVMMAPENGRLIVDCVYKLEEIDQAWADICDRLGIQVALDATNVNHHPPHGAILNDTSRRVIEQVFAEDLDRFGYSFQPK